jgi:hypothetical protein
MAYSKFKLERSINIVNNSYLLIPLFNTGDSKIALQIKRRQVSSKSSVQYGGTCDRNILESGKEFSANNTVSPLLLPLPALVNGRCHLLNYKSNILHHDMPSLYLDLKLHFQCCKV